VLVYLERWNEMLWAGAGTVKMWDASNGDMKAHFQVPKPYALHLKH